MKADDTFFFSLLISTNVIARDAGAEGKRVAIARGRFSKVSVSQRRYYNRHRIYNHSPPHQINKVATHFSNIPYLV